MAPDQYCYGPMHVTQLRLTGREIYANPFGYVKPRNVETKKQRIKRIATEKMLASWKLHNQKTPTIIEIKQFCKPSHRVGHMGIRIYK